MLLIVRNQLRYHHQRQFRARDTNQFLFVLPFVVLCLNQFLLASLAIEPMRTAQLLELVIAAFSAFVARSRSFSNAATCWFFAVTKAASSVDSANSD